MADRESFAEVRVDVDPSARRATSQPESDTPFRILVLADLSGRASRGVCEPLAGRMPELVDPDTIEDLPARLGVRVAVPLGEGLPSVELPAGSIEDFEPDQLWAKLPIFQAVRAARKRLSNPQTSAEELARYRPAPLAAPVPPPPSGASLLEEIVGGALPTSSAPPPTQPSAQPLGDEEWREVIRRIVAPHLVPKPNPQLAEMMAEVDRAAGSQMRTILHNPHLQQVEAAWRGLFFLLRRLETGVDLQVHAVDVSREELGSPASAAALRKLLTDEGPWAVAIGLYTFGASEADTALLAQMGGVFRSTGLAFVAGGSAHLAGCESFGAVPDPDDWRRPLPPEEAAAWRKLRALPEAGSIGLVLPRFLIRLPYGEGGASVESFDFQEMNNGPEHESYLWCNGAVFCAALLGEAFQREGWPMRAGSVQELDGLPVHTLGKGANARSLPVAEVLMTERAALRMMEEGLMVLASMKHRDAARLLRIQSIASPAQTLPGPWQ